MEQLVYLDPRDIHPMPEQPRTSMDWNKINGLADTFREHGFRGSIIIWYPRPNHAEIISGHRSHTAFQLIAEEKSFQPPWNLIPCAVFDNITEAKAYELAVLYNEKREDLTLIELAMSWQKLIDKYHYTAEQIAASFETSRSTVYNTISVLKEPQYILDYLKAGQLMLPDILGLRRIKDPTKRKYYTEKLVNGEIAKSDIPDIAQRLNRQRRVLDLIPELEADLSYDSVDAAPRTRMQLHIPADFILYFTFGASTRINWEILPQRNILVSGYNILHRGGKQAMVVDMINKRQKMDKLMIDSAAIVAMSKGDTSWFKQQPALVEFANAVEADVVSHLDVLCKIGLLETCKLTVAEAQQITINNAREMLDLKTKAKKCFVLQGHESEEYGKCIDAFNELGIFDDSEHHIIGVGSQAGERRETTVRRYEYVCKHVRRLNPSIGIHAFGIGSPWTLVELYKLGVTQADNQTPHVLTRVNKWIDSRTGEPNHSVRLCDDRITAMYDSQLLWNYAAYYVGLSNEFKEHENGRS